LTALSIRGTRYATERQGSDLAGGARLEAGRPHPFYDAQKLTEPGERLEQAVERAIGDELVATAARGDHVLADATAVPAGLDDLEILALLEMAHRGSRGEPRVETSQQRQPEGNHPSLPRRGPATAYEGCEGTGPATRGTRASVIVRVVRDRRGTGCGVIERVATGAKEAFPGVEASPVIARMGGAGGGRPPVAQPDRQRGGPPQCVWTLHRRAPPGKTQPPAWPAGHRTGTARSRLI
jgi:hypothetical protein